jgi:hypothetical protein
MLNALIILLMPTVFFGIMSLASMSNNSILRVGGVFVGFAGMMLSIIFLIVNVIIWVG